VGPPVKAAAKSNTTGTRPTTASQRPRPAAGGTTAARATGVKKEDVELLEKQVTELSSNNQILDKEREFYFSKLRLIEEMI